MESSLDWTVQLPVKKNSWLHYAKRVRLANRTPMFAVSQNSAMHVLRVLRSKNTNAKHAWLLCLIQFQILIALHFIASHCNALHCITLHSMDLGSAAGGVSPLISNLSSNHVQQPSPKRANGCKW